MRCHFLVVALCCSMMVHAVVATETMVDDDCPCATVTIVKCVADPCPPKPPCPCEKKPEFVTPEHPPLPDPDAPLRPGQHKLKTVKVVSSAGIEGEFMSAATPDPMGRQPEAAVVVLRRRNETTSSSGASDEGSASAAAEEGSESGGDSASDESNEVSFEPSDSGASEETEETEETKDSAAQHNGSMGSDDAEESEPDETEQSSDEESTEEGEPEASDVDEESTEEGEPEASDVDEESTEEAEPEASDVDEESTEEGEPEASDVDEESTEEAEPEGSDDEEESTEAEPEESTEDEPEPSKEEASSSKATSEDKTESIEQQRLDAEREKLRLNHQLELAKVQEASVKAQAAIAKADRAAAEARRDTVRAQEEAGKGRQAEARQKRVTAEARSKSSSSSKDKANSDESAAKKLAHDRAMAQLRAELEANKLKIRESHAKAAAQAEKAKEQVSKANEGRAKQGDNVAKLNEQTAKAEAAKAQAEAVKAQAEAAKSKHDAAKQKAAAQAKIHEQELKTKAAEAGEQQSKAGQRTEAAKKKSEEGRQKLEAKNRAVAAAESRDKRAAAEAEGRAKKVAEARLKSQKAAKTQEQQDKAAAAIKEAQDKTRAAERKFRRTQRSLENCVSNSDKSKSATIKLHGKANAMQKKEGNTEGVVAARKVVVGQAKNWVVTSAGCVKLAKPALDLAQTWEDLASQSGDKELLKRATKAEQECAALGTKSDDNAKEAKAKYPAFVKAANEAEKKAEAEARDVQWFPRHATQLRVHAKHWKQARALELFRNFGRSGILHFDKFGSGGWIEVHDDRPMWMTEASIQIGAAGTRWYIQYLNEKTGNWVTVFRTPRLNKGWNNFKWKVGGYSRFWRWYNVENGITPWYTGLKWSEVRKNVPSAFASTSWTPSKLEQVPTHAKHFKSNLWAKLYNGIGQPSILHFDGFGTQGWIDVSLPHPIVMTGVSLQIHAGLLKPITWKVQYLDGNGHWKDISNGGNVFGFWNHFAWGKRVASRRWRLQCTRNQAQPWYNAIAWDYDAKATEAAKKATADRVEWRPTRAMQVRAYAKVWKPTRALELFTNPGRSGILHFDKFGNGGYVEFMADEPLYMVESSMQVGGTGGRWEIQYLNEKTGAWVTVKKTGTMNRGWNTFSWRKTGASRFWRWYYVHNNIQPWFTGFKWKYAPAKDSPVFVTKEWVPSTTGQVRAQAKYWKQNKALLLFTKHQGSILHFDKYGNARGWVQFTTTKPLVMTSSSVFVSGVNPKTRGSRWAIEGLHNGKWVTVANSPPTGNGITHVTWGSKFASTQWRWRNTQNSVTPWYMGFEWTYDVVESTKQQKLALTMPKWTHLDGDMSSLSISNERRQGKYPGSFKIDSRSKKGVTVTNWFGKKVDQVNYHFTIWFYDTAQNDRRNDWIGLGTRRRGILIDNVIGIYSDKRHYSTYPSWKPSHLSRQVGWHKYEFVGTRNGVWSYVDGEVVAWRQYKGPVAGFTIRGNVKSVAYWSPWTMKKYTASAPTDLNMWRLRDGVANSFSTDTSRVAKGFKNSIKVDSRSHKGGTISQYFAGDFNRINFRFTIWFYDDSNSDSRNDWIGIGRGSGERPYFTDHILGIYKYQDKVSTCCGWHSTDVRRRPGWYKYEFVGTSQNVKYYINGKLVKTAPFRGAIAGITIRSNVKSVAYWSPYTAKTETPKKKAVTLVSGVKSWGAWNSGVRCHWINFGRNFGSKRVFVEATIDHRSYGGSGTHDATTVWIENIQATRFRACVSELAQFGNGGHDGNLHLAWFATTEAMDSKQAIVSYRFPAWGGGTICRDVHYGKTLRNPRVFATINHRSYGGSGVHDRTAVWVQGIQNNRARVCVRETKHHGRGSHDSNLWIDLLAMEAVPSGFKSGSERFPGWSSGTHCRWVGFGKTFSRTPKFFATINHRHRSHTTTHDAITVFAENIQRHRARVCVRELAFDSRGGHDVLYVDWAVTQ